MKRPKKGPKPSQVFWSEFLQIDLFPNRTTVTRKVMAGKGWAAIKINLDVASGSVGAGALPDAASSPS